MSCRLQKHLAAGMKAETEFSAALAAAKPCDYFVKVASHHLRFGFNRVGDRIFKVERLYDELPNDSWTSFVMASLMDADKKDRTVRVAMTPVVADVLTDTLHQLVFRSLRFFLRRPGMWQVSGCTQASQRR